MKTSFPKPRVFISKCLGFDHCRWNGDIISDKFVEALKTHITCVTTCPECDIGLGVPRDPIRMVLQDKTLKLMQLNTGADITQTMTRFVSHYIGSLDEIDGFILKDRSPSCGLKDVKVYPGLEPSSSVTRMSGFFAQGVETRFEGMPVETEARLNNFSLREHFLIRIFTLARFRMIEKDFSMKDLVDFHTRHKLLLMAYNQTLLKRMGNRVANADKQKPESIFADYRKNLFQAMSKPIRFSSGINVLMHALGYVSQKMTSEEKGFFLNSLEEYRREQVPLSVPLNLMRSYSIRWEDEYLQKQVFFEPYPSELVFISDSGKGRKA